jgi:hypothetical protein
VPQAWNREGRGLTKAKSPILVAYLSGIALGDQPWRTQSIVSIRAQGRPGSCLDALRGPESPSCIAASQTVIEQVFERARQESDVQHGP